MLWVLFASKTSNTRYKTFYRGFIFSKTFFLHFCLLHLIIIKQTPRINLNQEREREERERKCVNQTETYTKTTAGEWQRSRIYNWERFPARVRVLWTVMSPTTCLDLTGLLSNTIHIFVSDKLRWDPLGLFFTLGTGLSDANHEPLDPPSWTISLALHARLLLNPIINWFYY